jgi:hypothetical protein
MFRTKVASIIFTAILLSTVAFAGNSSPTFTTIDNPADPTFNQLLGINTSGVISGYFGSGQAGHPNQGYTIAPPYTEFVPENLPGSVQTQVTGINGSVTTGFWAPTNTGTDSNYGFIREANGFTYISVNNPLGTGSFEVNQVLGINKSNIAVGFYADANGSPHGYAYNVTDGKFTPVGPNGAASSTAAGINSSNLICGSFTNTNGQMKAFLKPLSGGQAIVFNVPDSQMTQFLGVNDSGVAVGFYEDSQNIDHGVIYNPSNGQWQTIDNPQGVLGTVLNGINDKNQVVGFFTDAANNVHGMLVEGLE